MDSEKKILILAILGCVVYYGYYFMTSSKSNRKISPASIAYSLSDSLNNTGTVQTPNREVKKVDGRQIGTGKEPNVVFEHGKEASAATEKLKVLSESLKSKDIAEIRELIKKGANVNIINKIGVTPLFMASQEGYEEIVKLLLEAKADVNIARESDGITPLSKASANGHTEVVKLLLGASAKETKISVNNLHVHKPLSNIQGLPDSLNSLERVFALALIESSRYENQASGSEPLVDFLKKSLEAYPPNPSEYRELEKDIRRIKQDADKSLQNAQQRLEFLNYYKERTKRFESAKTAVGLYISAQTDKNWEVAWNEIAILVTDLNGLIGSKMWHDNVSSSASIKIDNIFNQFKSDLGSLLTQEKENMSSENMERIKRLKGLSTRQACMEYIQRAYDLENSAKSILDSANSETIGVFSMEKEKEFLEILRKWTVLWEDMAVYYSEFEPASDDEFYGELFAKILASITEAAVVSEFVGSRFISPEHYKVLSSICKLRIKILEISNEIQVPLSELENPRSISSFRVPELKSTFTDSNEMSEYFQDLSSRFKGLYPGRVPVTKSIDKKFRLLVDEMSCARLKAGAFLDRSINAQLIDLYRIDISLSIIESLSVYACYKTSNMKWAEIGLQTAQTKKEDLEAMLALLNRIKEWQKKKDK